MGPGTERTSSDTSNKISTHAVIEIRSGNEIIPKITTPRALLVPSPTFLLCVVVVNACI